MTPLTFSVQREDGPHFHFDNPDRAADALVRLMKGEPGVRFVAMAHGAPPVLTVAQERGHARAAGLSPRERSAIATIAAIARAESLTPERRSEIARNASLARWRGQPEAEAG
jgi:hypothetical protein